MIEIIGPLANPGAATVAGGGEKSVSLQKQLIERLQQAILTGRLPAGSLLPSSRLLAAEMGVSRNTVVIAYEHLAAVGYRGGRQKRHARESAFQSGRAR
jgi:Transcriptional regulators containing a DNA-binding HTH domain and an aminotransferase domain (MocR family) and their eukaryotic orthologs